MRAPVTPSPTPRPARRPPPEPAVLDGLPLPAAGAAVTWPPLHGAGEGLAVAAAAARADAAVVAVCRDPRRLRRLQAELEFFLGGDLPVLPLPDWECLPYDRFSPHEDILSRRLATLAALTEAARGVVLVTVANLMQRLPPGSFVKARAFRLQRGQAVDREALRRRLLDAAYQPVAQVAAPGEFAVRGGLMDIFPMGAPSPFRLDLFGDEIESIRLFDPDSQRTTREVERVALLPAREFPFDAEAIRRFRGRYRAVMEGDPQASLIYREVSAGRVPNGIEFYFPLFFEATETLFDYLPRDSLWITDDGLEAEAEALAEDIRERFETARLDRERPPLPPAELYLTPGALADLLAPRRRVRLAGLPAPGQTGGGDGHTRPLPPLAATGHGPSPYAALLEFLSGFPGRVLLVAESPGHRENLAGVLRDQGLAPKPCGGWRDFLAGADPLMIATAGLERGLWLPGAGIALVTETQLYGERVIQRRRRDRRRREPEAIIRSLAELQVGDPVVHERYGVGRYRGLEPLDMGGGRTEFIALEYRDGDRLYIPVLSIDQISRYTGTDPERAPLHKLGTQEWERAKRRARQRIHDVAVEILEIQALRRARKGHAYPPPDADFEQFCAGFPFEETPDQARAITDVIGDMTAERPMDRLVCGDVGFGKTEVALRAAFLAVQGRRQVAVLVPTTLLAQQHFETFRDRFAGHPVRVEVLSRFRRPAELRAVLADLAAGKVDIVIGTHRLLQADVRFRNLGLVIIDEEHRFGVRQKERLKKLRHETDVLSLTATPIPRTLNLALGGLRDISIIATAPDERLAVKTFVSEWNDVLVREACLREFRRGGQVYFLYNDVKSMDRMAERLAKLVPEARLRIAHGQMPERALEQVMQDFYHQRFNLLLCSTIIESGIDIPSANTIIIHRADRFGLAQLHQLRGRVGRSHHRAYAYLIIPPRRALAGDALKRLEAIAALDVLGAGYALAAHDLEIRGGGELLGEAQSGMIDEIGFSLYMDLLNRTIDSLRAGRAAGAGAPPPERGDVQIELHLPVLLPEDYIPDVHTRLLIYKRIAGTRGEDAFHALRAELVDRFGPLPEAADNLLRVARLKQAAARLDLARIELGPRGGRLVFGESPRVDPQALLRLIQAAPDRYRMEDATTLRLRGELPDGEARLALLAEILEALSATPDD